MKVVVQVKSTIRYLAEVSMTKREYEDWNARLNKEGDRATFALMDRCKIDPGDPSDWGDPEIDDFYPTKRSGKT